MPQKDKVGMEALMDMITSTDIVGFAVVFTCSLQQLGAVSNISRLALLVGLNKVLLE